MNPPPPAAFTADEHEAPDPPHLPSLGFFANARKYLAIVGAVVIAGGVVFLIGYAMGRGKSRGELAAALTRVDSLERARAAVDTVYARDTVQLTRWLTRWDSVRVVDTLMRDSIVYVRRDVADGTVAACLVTLHDCERQRALADSLIRVLRDIPVIDERPRFVLGGAGGYDPIGKGAAFRVDGRLRVAGPWSIDAAWQATHGAKPIGFVGARRELLRWP